MVRNMIGKSTLSQNLSVLTALLCLSFVSGCKMPASGTTYASDTSNPFEKQTSTEPSVQLASASEPTPSPDQRAGQSETDLASVLGQLDQIGQIDPRAREKLVNDLQSVKPDLWPLMIQQFKSALAYRQGVTGAPQPRLGSAETEATTHVASKVDSVPVSHVTKPALTSAQPSTPPPTAISLNQPANAEPVVVSDSTPQRPTPPAHLKMEESSTLPPPPPRHDLPSVAAKQLDSHTRQVSYTPSATSDGDWQGDLNATISKMQSRVNAQPASTAEMHEHVQLRILQLLAGQRGEAMVPIPGASPALQDYWSKQLFAISTHLDHEQQPDEKRRVASSLYHLDQARAKLAQLATLQVRNLNIVESVDGFGVYQPRESLEFRPGAPVSLYAEVENLQSESTQEGYRALLSTSYEVVDISGQRVDGRQFPDVEDVCKNPRRDFHMQYGVTLPERIYPGEYQLRLTITDQLSHKIGQASVSFVIVE